MKRKIYKYQIFFLMFFTSMFLIGLYTVFFTVKVHPLISLELIFGGIGLDATVISSIFDKKK